MPAYDFRCEPCDTTFEVVRSARDRTGVSCPDCGSVARRVFSPVGVVFRGSGFHNTDYRKKPEAPKGDTPKGVDAPACGTSKACDSCPAASGE